MTDGELVRRVVAGDTAAYGELARRWFGRIQATCQAKVFDGEAEDLVQEVLIRGFANLGSLADPELFGPWLRGIASNLCADWCRSHLRNGRTPAPGVRLDQVGAAPDCEGRIEDDERHIILAQIATMPEELREVILLRYYNELTYEEMAQWLGVARATVNERLAKARALLRIRLAKLRSDL